MPKRTVKIIKGIGPGLSTKQLEEVSMRLLLSRIRGSEPHISFTFVQRLLDELILRRHDEVKLDAEIKQALADTLVVQSDQEWVNGSDDEQDSDDHEDSYETLAHVDEWKPSESFDLRTLDYSDLRTETQEEEEEEEDDDEEEAETLIPVYSKPVKPRRRPVLACSKPRHNAWATVNPLRVLTISILVVLVLACGFIFAGCNHHDRDKSTHIPDATDSVDGIYFVYKDINQNTVELDLERRGNILSAAVLVIDAFKKEHGSLPDVWICEVYVGPTVADNPSYVPCGIVNGGGCFTYSSRRMMVYAGECDNVPYIYHELNHARLEQAGADRVNNNGHQGKSWEVSRQITYDLRHQICDSRAPAPAPVLTDSPPLAMPR
jgi:hypothetical protein